MKDAVKSTGKEEMFHMPETNELVNSAAAAPVPITPKKPRKKLKLGKWIFFGLLAVGVAFIGYNAMKAAGAKPLVYYDQAVTQDIDATLSVSGRITPSETRSYFVPGSVKVAQVNFKQGDRVKKGDVIASFDLTELKSSLKKAQLTLENAQLQYDDTMEDLDNSSQELYDINKEIRRLEARETTYKLAYDYFDRYPTNDPELDEIIAAHDHGEGSGEMYDAWQDIAEELAGKIAARSALRDADLSENNQKVLQNNLELQKLEYEDIARLVNESQGGIVSEFDGIITQLNLTEGAAVSSGMDAVRVASTEGILLRFSVGKYDVDRIQLGQTADVTFGSKKLTGTVTRLDGAATEETSGGTTSTVLKGDLTIEDPDQVLKLGMDANAKILTAQAFGAVSVPVEAVKVDRDGDYVWTITPCTEEKAAQAGLWELHKKYVTSGIFDDVYIEILDGLAAGDCVCTTLPSDPAEGAQVQAVPVGAAAEAALAAGQGQDQAGAEG